MFLDLLQPSDVCKVLVGLCGFSFVLVGPTRSVIRPTRDARLEALYQITMLRAGTLIAAAAAAESAFLPPAASPHAPKVRHNFL